LRLSAIKYSTNSISRERRLRIRWRESSEELRKARARRFRVGGHFAVIDVYEASTGESSMGFAEERNRVTRIGSAQCA